jgi:NAD(P)-dependent dehydrogenase (short-subunit alcohol dehydrogenase family)
MSPSPAPQVVLVTGSSTGFGFLTAQRLASQGHQVYASMREADGKNAPHARRLRELAQRGDHRLTVIDLDVTDDASVDGAVARIAAEAGRVDVLVNNAGIWGPGVLEAFTLDQWHEVFAVNLFGSVRVARAVLPHMRSQRHGLVVQISSLQGRFILPYSGPYVASKHAVEGAMETFRYEVAPYGVEVCIVQPYDFMTELKQKAGSHTPADHAREASYGERTATMIETMYLTPDPTRAGDPEEVVDAIDRLIATPPGERPIRVTVRNPLPQIEQINQLAQEMHAGLFPAIGLADLLRLRLDDA